MKVYQQVDSDKCSKNCVARRWKISPTSFPLVECLHTDNTSVVTIKRPLVCTGADVGSMELKSTRNGTAIKRRPNQDLVGFQHPNRKPPWGPPNQISSSLKGNNERKKTRCEKEVNREKERNKQKRKS